MSDGGVGVRKLLSSMWVKESGSASAQVGAPEALATGSEHARERLDSPPQIQLSPGMRRNLTASAALSTFGKDDKPLTSAERESLTSAMRRNTSVSTLSELRRREQSAQHNELEGSRGAVIEAVACRLLELVVGKETMLDAMRERRPSSSPGRCGDQGSSQSGAGGTAESDGGSPPAARAPPGIAASLQAYILTIVKHLELPNSCIVAALIYVLRAVSSSRFTLSLSNWQPCLLAAFVISAKLSFDEPVWNEDFVKALRISNVQVSQISRWEADFLMLLSFNTNVNAPQYAAACFDLQKAHELLHGRPCHFFTYLMSLSAIPNPADSAADMPPDVKGRK